MKKRRQELELRQELRNKLGKELPELRNKLGRELRKELGKCWGNCSRRRLVRL